MNSQLSATLRNQIRNRPAKLAAENIRNYPQPAWPVSATAENYRVARRQATFLFLESSDNHPTKRRNHPMESANRPIIDRRNPSIDRIGQTTDCTRNNANVQSTCNAGQCNRAKALFGIRFRELRIARDLPTLLRSQEQDPHIANREPDFGVTSLNFGFAELLARAGEPS